MARLAQRFGTEINSETVCDADFITALEFDGRGDYLAAGDRAGRVVLFDRKEADTDEGESKRPETEWKPYFQFKSHTAEFDYLKSLPIEEKINQIRFLPQIGNNKFVLSTNDKTVKLWKVGERQMKISDGTENLSAYSFEALRLPRISKGTEIAAMPKRVYQNAHMYHINSISLNSDCETFLSADDLRINWWNHDRSDTCFNIIDVKPPMMAELTEVITSAQFHPSHCNVLMYSSSRGVVKVVDTRQAAICDHSAVCFEEKDECLKCLYSEIISSISDASFSRDGRYVVARDYMTLKIWDMNMNKSPLKTIAVAERLRPLLPDLYDNDCIFDKFNASFSADGNVLIIYPPI